MENISAIASGKGGVGKSTLTAGIGAALAARGERVLLIDGDAGLQSLDHLLGLSEQLVYNACDIADGRIDPLKAVYSVPKYDGLFLLSAPLGKPLHPKMMSAITTVLARHFDRVLIDCPAGVGSNLISSVAPAREIFLVATSDPISVRSAAIVKNQLEQMDAPISKFILNRFSAPMFRKAAYFKDLDAIVDSVGLPLLGIVPEDKKCSLQYIKGDMPAKIGGKKTASLAFSRIAARICGESVPLPKGF